MFSIFPIGLDRGPFTNIFETTQVIPCNLLFQGRLFGSQFSGRWWSLKLMLPFFSRAAVYASPQAPSTGDNLGMAIYSVCHGDLGIRSVIRGGVIM